MKGMRELRKATGLSVKEVGEAVGKSASYISRIESGNVANTSYDTLIKIAKIVASTEAIRENKIDIDKYESEFVNLVSICKYKDVIDNNRKSAILEYDEMLKYLTGEELNAIKDIVEYRKVKGSLSSLRGNSEIIRDKIDGNKINLSFDLNKLENIEANGIVEFINGAILKKINKIENSEKK